MKICIICDLHLPYNHGTSQYRALDFALSDAAKKGADLILFAGDATADGNIESFAYFKEKLQNCGVPYLFIPGNSDLRTPQTAEKIANSVSDTHLQADGFNIYGINDSAAQVSDNAFEMLKNAGENDIVFMHHPVRSLKKESRERFTAWRESHPKTMLFYGHLHEFIENGRTVSLPAIDPDKNVGTSPGTLYYDTESGELERAYYFCPVPRSFYKYIGVSAGTPKTDIPFAAKHKLSSLEINYAALKTERPLLKAMISDWRNSGGNNLSLHLPDIVFENGKIANAEKFAAFTELANDVKVDRVTLHVPKMSVGDAEHHIETVADFAAGIIEKLPEKCTVGVENMHMTEKDDYFGVRRFGYTPEECKLFAGLLKKLTSHKIGFNLDIGHARNNAPFSQKYTLSAWYAELGNECVGYHLHQVKLLSDGTMKNHSAITGFYEKLVSLASLFEGIAVGTLNTAPFIFEIREPGGLEKAVELFEREEKRKIADIHSHTYFSNCGRDDPDDLVETAVRNGLSTLGICDHSYGIGDRKREYISFMRELSKKYSDKIEIICGIEIPTVPHRFDFPEYDYSEISDYDYCLIEHITYPESIVGGDMIEFCKKIGIKCGIAHTDMFEYCDIYGYKPETLFAQMAQNGIFWEMNASYDSIHKYSKHAYVERLMNSPEQQKIVKQSGLELSVGFDGHRREDYDGQRVYDIYNFFKENGFKLVK